MKTMTEAEIRVAMTLLDEEGKAWVEAVKLGRYVLYCDCGIHGVFDTREELLGSNEYDSARHSGHKHDLAIQKITKKTFSSLRNSLFVMLLLKISLIVTTISTKHLMNFPAAKFPKKKPCRSCRKWDIKED